MIHGSDGTCKVRERHTEPVGHVGKCLTGAEPSEGVLDAGATADEDRLAEAAVGVDEYGAGFISP
ncbi:hypothetical protein [Frankia gtarii]|uniref:hypothetical protein n=1 Tax=Frankia gtarii TaxID=2950102 RepID=UPI0021C156F8|nr:hypothetical protein [Frankia gtarii]